MIKVTKFDGNIIVINSEMIESIEATPDTVITMTTKNKILVKERLDEVIAKVIEFKQKIHGFPDKGESSN